MNYIKQLINYVKIWLNIGRMNKSMSDIAAKFILNKIKSISKSNIVFRELLLIRRFSTSLLNEKCKDVLINKKITKEEMLDLDALRKTNISMNTELNVNFKRIKELYNESADKTGVENNDKQV